MFEGVQTGIKAMITLIEKWAGAIWLALWSRSEGIMILALLTFAFAFVGKLAFTKGGVEYCTVQLQAPPTGCTCMAERYVVIGHRHIQNDLTMGSFENFQAAVDGAGKLGCSLH